MSKYIMGTNTLLSITPRQQVIKFRGLCGRGQGLVTLPELLTLKSFCLIGVTLLLLAVSTPQKPNQQNTVRFLYQESNHSEILSCTNKSLQAQTQSCPKRVHFGHWTIVAVESLFTDTALSLSQYQSQHSAPISTRRERVCQNTSTMQDFKRAHSAKKS